MPITWKNLGQSSNSGNALIAGSANTITSGIESIQAAAQSVTDEQNRQYNTQADINTAGILSDINRLDQEGVDAFNIDSLTKQFGSQFDSTQIADALDNRVGDLRDAAQQTLENERADARLDSNLATQSLNRKNLTGQIATRERAEEKARKFAAFDKEVNNNLADYSSIEDIQRRVTKQGQKAGQSPQEINQAIQSASQTFRNNIEIQPTQQALLDQRAQQQSLLVSQSIASQENALENAARKRGVIPELAELSTTRDDDTNNVQALSKQYDPIIADAGLGKEGSVTAFQSLLAKKFKEQGLGSPNGAELKYFLELGFDEGSFRSDGLNFDNIENDLNKYLKMRQNKPALKSYQQAKAAIQNGARQTAKTQARDLKSYADTIRANNKARFTGEGINFKEAIPTQLVDRRTDALKTQNWFQ